MLSVFFPRGLRRKRGEKAINWIRVFLIAEIQRFYFAKVT